MRILRNATIAAVFLIFVMTGCLWFQNIRVPDRIEVGNSQLPDLEEADFLQSSIIYSPQIPEIAARLKREADIAASHWNVSIQHQLAGFARQNQAQFQLSSPGTSSRPLDHASRELLSSEDILLAEHLNRITSESRRVSWNGHVFYILSVAIDTHTGKHSGVQFESTEFEEPSRHYRIYALDEEGIGVTFFETKKFDPVFVSDGLPHNLPGQSLQFSVLIDEQGPVVIYRDRDGIHSRQLLFHNLQSGRASQGNGGQTAILSGGGSSFSFGEGQLIANAEKPYGEYQMLARSDQSGKIHLLWTDSRDRKDLWYCNILMNSDEICNSPKRIAKTVSLAPVNLMVQDDDQIYLSWTDHRFAQGVWTVRNSAKIMIAKSNDGGETFSSPVSVNKPRDESDTVTYAVTLPAGDGGVLVFWGTSSYGTQSRKQDMYYGWLTSNLETLRIGSSQIHGSSLHDIIHRYNLDFHYNLGR